MNKQRALALSSTRANFLALLLTLLAFGVRVWQLDSVPPGWSDDELSNILVISQKVFQGDYSVYYVDATGLEALYHVVAGGFLALLGYNTLGIRLLSALLGTLTIPLTYRVGSRLFDRTLGLLAAAGLAVSFWSLIYSRINLRHIALPVFLLATVYFFLRGLEIGDWRARASPISFIAAGTLLGVSFYTYFASRGVPVILLGFLLYLALVEPVRLRRKWRSLLLMLGLSALLALPLLLALQNQPGADARVAEVAVPLVEAREGNFDVLWEHVLVTLSMFHADGDGEFLYNIPHRPVFGPIGAAFFWGGVLLALCYTLQPLTSHATTLTRATRTNLQSPISSPRSLSSAFLLLWWLAGITPAFLSVPPASLGHTIIAQPATYLLAALPITLLARRGGRPLHLVSGLFAFLLLGSVAISDLPAYFEEWPGRGMTRFLYNADVADLASWLAEQPEYRDFAVTSLLTEPWSREAFWLTAETEGLEAVQPRWYDPTRAIVLELSGEPAVAFTDFPALEHAYEEHYAEAESGPPGAYRIRQVQAVPEVEADPICFVNGLCLYAATYVPETGKLHLSWQVAYRLTLPERPLVSKPPPPGVYAGPRLRVFAHLVDGEGGLLVANDGLWVDPAALQRGDLFMQQHRLPLPEGAGARAIRFGLYDPLTGERIATEDGRDHLRLDLR